MTRRSFSATIVEHANIHLNTGSRYGLGGADQIRMKQPQHQDNQSNLH